MLRPLNGCQARPDLTSQANNPTKAPPRGRGRRCPAAASSLDSGRVGVRDGEASNLAAATHHRFHPLRELLPSTKSGIRPPGSFLAREGQTPPHEFFRRLNPNQRASPAHGGRRGLSVRGARTGIPSGADQGNVSIGESAPTSPRSTTSSQHRPSFATPAAHPAPQHAPQQKGSSR